MGISEARYISLATYRRSGAAVATPVWFASTSELIHYCFSAADAGKVKRLRNSGRASVAVCDARGRVTGEWIEAEAFLVKDVEETDRGYTALMRKYGWQMRVTNLLSRMSGRINNRALIRIELQPT